MEKEPKPTREITEEVRTMIRTYAEGVVRGANLDDPKREEALESLISIMEKWYQEGHDILPPEPKLLSSLEWKDGKWNLETDWLDKKWGDSERFLVRRK